MIIYNYSQPILNCELVFIPLIVCQADSYNQS